MRPSDYLKTYIGYFQNHLALHNCCENTSALIFISGLRITHPLYKHLIKYNVTRWSEVLYRAQPYIQLEEAMKSQPTRLSTATKTEQNKAAARRLLLHWPPGSWARCFQEAPMQGQPRAYQIFDSFTSLKLPIQDAFEAIKGQLWVKRPEANTRDPTHPKLETTVPSTTTRDTELLNASLSASFLKILSSKAISESTSLHTEPPPRQKTVGDPISESTATHDHSIQNGWLNTNSENKIRKVSQMSKNYLYFIYFSCILLKPFNKNAFWFSLSSLHFLRIRETCSLTPA